MPSSPPRSRRLQARRSPTLPPANSAAVFRPGLQLVLALALVLAGLVVVVLLMQ